MQASYSGTAHKLADIAGVRCRYQRNAAALRRRYRIGVLARADLIGYHHLGAERARRYLDPARLGISRKYIHAKPHAAKSRRKFAAFIYHRHAACVPPRREPRRDRTHKRCFSHARRRVYQHAARI